MSAPPDGSLAADLAGELFGVAGPDLTVGGIPVRVLARDFGTPAFIYDAALMRGSLAALTAALAGFATVHYSVKANPHPEVIRVFVAAGAGTEIASIGEYRAAVAAGADRSRILFAGPGKRAAEIAQVVAGGIGEIHLETNEEIARVEAVAAAAGRRVPVSIRFNPVADAQGGAMRMGGKAAPFGFDEEDIAVVDRVAGSPHLDLKGVHLFAGTQILDAAVLIGQWRHGLDLAARVAERAGRPLSTIDLGGGLGIPYFAGEAPLDLEAVRLAVPDLIAGQRRHAGIAAASVIVEPGRYLVGPAGVYLTEVNAVKVSRGQRFVIVDGGMHHHLAASGNLGQVIKRDYPVLAASAMDAGGLSPASVVGPLCTPLDTLARKAMLPGLKAGDLIAVLQSGAYGLTASPAGFLSHPPPAEVLVDGGRARRI